MDQVIVNLCTIMFFHWVADFIMQPDKMAVSKSSSNVALTHHVLIYSAVMLVVAFAIFDFHNAIFFVVINGVLHWGVDWCTSRTTSYLYEEGDRHTFFVVIGLDQLLHFLSLSLTYNWVINA